MSALLDVNVLVALGWPNHVHHVAARKWFDAHASIGWATTPVTEGGFVRTSSNRSALPTSTTPAIAVDLLTRLTRLGAHEFWSDDVPFIAASDAVLLHRLRGHRQVTDAHLLALATRRQGRVATFDRALVDLDPDVVELIASAA